MESIRRGFLSGLSAVALLYVAALPSRLAIALRGWGSFFSRAERALAGSLLDLSAVVLIITPLVAVMTLLVPLVLRRARSPGWQRLGSVLWAFPFGFALWVLTVTAQEVKSERGSFPTMFDLLEGGTNASFVEGTVGFIRYERIWEPAVIGTLLSMVVLVLIWRRPRGELGPWRAWAMGMTFGLGTGAAGVFLLALGLATAANRFTAAALGDPLTGLVESTVDLIRHRGPATPRELVLDAELPPQAAKEGAALLGWPATRPGPHPHARPLDFTAEPMTRDPRGRRLLEALQRASAALFTDEAPEVAVFHLSLEGFRADDVHALNPLAPKDIAPFTTSLYEDRQPGVLTSRKLFQAGVRTAHCLGAMTCGLGTLPYNLSFIRDLQPFPVRCTSDVLHDAGFAHSFFYGSDGTFDEMHRFFSEHGYSTLVTQAELPATLPKGTWDGVTDFAVFELAVKHVAEAVKTGPQFALLMSLSNHSPFTAPQDLPPEVVARVDRGLKTAVNRADSDDRLRLMTYSYTDAAVQRVFEQLEATGLAERSIVMLMADHSTGHAYVWGKEDPESDEAKSQIPFALVIPKAFLARAKDPVALEAALREVQALIDEAVLSQNDVPTLLLALLSAHPAVKALPEAKRWHTLGGQVTSPHFAPGGDPASYILGINGVSELFALDRQGKRVGGYEDSVFLKTRADRYRVTPRLIPVTATLIETMKSAPPR
ncbi:MAG: LTA synthase family protein [Myxococcota bacterium]